MKNKKHKGSGLPAGVPEAIIVFSVLLAVFLIIFLANLFAPPADFPEKETESAADANNRQELLSPDITLPLALGDGIFLTGLYAVDAVFPEDGSNAPGENLLCAVINNKSGKTLEYMTFNLTADESTYEFSVTTLPSSCDVYVFEKYAAQAPEEIAALTAETQIQLFFDEEPELMEEELEITVRDGTIDIKNISDTPIDREIQVYYKNTENLAYFGGITYFLRVPAGLAPGEVYNGYAANASMARTEVMFVKYGK